MTYRGRGAVFSKRCGFSGWVGGLVLGVLSCGCGKSAGPLAEAAPATPVTAPTGPLSAEEVTEYLLAVINRDRAEHDLDPVQLDQTASRAAERHVRDMTIHGFTGHWGTDGSVPEQRYTEAGGVHMVQENAACFFDGELRELDPQPVFNADDVAKIQKAFMDEVPPNDGHRRNILKPWHTHVGLAVAKPAGIPQACLVQEFIDAYGEYEALPAKAKVGKMVRVAGSVKPPVTFGAIGVGRIEAAKSIPVSKLLETGSYPIPDPQILYAPEGYETPKPVKVDGNQFEIEVPLSVQNQPGRYEVSVWGKYPGAEAFVMVSLRTIDVR